MKVYIANYDNGESYEDFSEWYGDKVYIDRRECEREILKQRYRLTKTGRYVRGNRYSYDYNNAKILELELV